MCGIAGIWKRKEDPCDLKVHLDLMSQHMKARGPDGHGQWMAPGRDLGFVHRRLAIIDLSPAGAQPMTLPGDAPVITFNGEIYNYRELRKDMADEGVEFHSESDTEVLLHLYRKHGPDMCRKLRGMFAFAIWDPARRGILLGRDPLGIKPLYYVLQDKRLLFASQIKALLTSKLVSRAPNPAGHAGFFLWGHCVDGQTLFESIHEVPAGATLWFSTPSSVDSKQYFELANTIQVGRSSEEPAPTLRDVLLDSVCAHLESDVPVSVFLSAGRDSATLVGLASELQQSDTHAVTVAFSEYEGTSNDEAPLAGLIAQHFDVRHEIVRISRSTFSNDLPHILDAMDSPTIDGVNTYYVSKAAAQLGVKVVLSGVGGDELFGGYPSFHQVPRLVSAGRRIPAAYPLGRAMRKVTSPWISNVASPKVAGILEYGGCIPAAFLLRRSLFMPWELPKVLGRDFAEAGLAALQTLPTMQRLIEPVSSEFGQIMALEMTYYMRDRLLRDSDWASMAHSLELRTPLVDHKLVGHVSGCRAKGGRFTKADLANTVARALPPCVLGRPKTGFQVPVAEWLLGRPPGSKRESSLREWSKIVYRSCTAN